MYIHIYVREVSTDRIMPTGFYALDKLGKFKSEENDNDQRKNKKVANALNIPNHMDCARILAFGSSLPEEQKQMSTDEKYWRLQQAHSIGMQYYCFNCLKSCPVGLY